MPVSPNAQYAYQYFLSKGLSPAQAAGIVGNLQAESGVNLDPEAVNSIGCIGIAQWCYGRRNPALQTGNRDKDFRAQLDYIWYEMNGPEHRTLTVLKATTTPADAARTFEAAFERSGGALLPRRQSYATELYSALHNAADLPVLDITDAQNAGYHVPGTNLDIPNPLQPVKDVSTFLTRLWGVFTSRVFWLRIGQFALGGLLLVLGAIFMLSESKAVTTA